MCGESEVAGGRVWAPARPARPSASVPSKTLRRSRIMASIGVADAEQELSPGMVVDGEHVAAVDELVLTLVGEVDALDRHLEMFVDRELDRGVDVERAVGPLHV